MLKVLADFYRLRKNQFRTKEKIKQIQTDKLSELLHYAYAHSEYYHEQFERAGITALNIDEIPLNEYPTIDKETLLKQFDKIVTIPGVTQEQLRKCDERDEMRTGLPKGCHYVHSSGSTGVPGYFLYDDSAWNTMLSGIIRGAFWGMCWKEIAALLISGAKIAYLAATDGSYGGVMAVGDGIAGVHAKELKLDINMPMREWITQIQTFQPNMVIGYPSAVKILAELVRAGSIQVKPMRIITCGEPLDVGLRAFIEDTFLVPVINFYGASESLAIGVEEHPEDGMILFDDLNIIESIDGKMYLTCLYNKAQPLIRYEITDSITLEEAGKQDAYPFSRIVGLLGRDEDVLWFTDAAGRKEFLHPLAIEGICMESLTDYQFRQTGSAAFEMYAQTSRTKTQELQEQIEAFMNKILQENGLDYVDFRIRFVDSILPNPKTGKKQLIVT